MDEVVIVSAVRTPVGRYGGGLSRVRPDDLAALVVGEAVRRAGVEPAAVDEVYLGAANQAGEDNRNVARMAALLAGFPPSVPGATVNRLCASGLEAVAQAYRAIAVGEAEVVVAGGVESMTRAPLVVAKAETAFARGERTAYDTTIGWRFVNPRLAALYPPYSMGETAENVAERFGVSRERQDAYALESHRRAVAAWREGLFEREVVAVPLPDGGTFARDEGPRSDTSLEKLARLRPAFRPGGTVTAGNSSSVNDGAAALVLMSAARARAEGRTVLARVRGSASAGVDPAVMGIGPIDAVRKLLARLGWTVADLERVELNEAFAAQVLPVMDALSLDPERTNVRGGAIAIGHPLGASGARILTTLLYALEAAGGGRGVATMCVGVGQGQALAVEV
ncbi:MAG: thiolase family protein [Firmicutes bacterium]|nr:thiolase family protein [Bacillota bacterium]